MPVLLAALPGILATAIVPAGTSLATVAAVTTALDVVATVAAGAAASVVIADLLKSPTPNGLRLTVRQETPARRRGVGVARVGGALLLDYANTTNDLFRVVAFVDGPVTNISRYYLSQDQVRLYTGATPTVEKLPNGGYPDNCCAIYTAFGQSGVTAFPELVTKSGGVWGDSASATGIFVGLVQCYGGAITNFQVAYPRNKPTLNIVGELCTAYDWRDDTQVQTDPTTWKNTSNPIVGLVSELWNFRGYSWELDFLPAIDILTAEANVCDAQINCLNVFTKTAIYTTVDLSYILIDPTGPIPPIGVTLYVGGQSFTVAGNDGTLTVDGYEGVKIDLSGALLAGVAYGNLVRWQVTPANPQTEPTYACGGAWNVDEAEKDTVKKFLDSCDGWMQRRGSDGAMVVRAGHYYEPTVVIGPDEVISYTWDEFTTSGKVYNQVVPSVVLPALDYNQVDSNPVQSDADIAEDGLSSQTFKPDFVQSNGQVMRLATWKLARVLVPVESLTLKASGQRVLGERFIRLELGDDEASELANQVVEICGKGEFIDNGMAIRFQVRPIDPTTLYLWDCYTDEGTGPLAAAPGVPQGFPPAQPTITNVSSFTDSETEGGTQLTGERLAVSVSPPAAAAARADLTWWLQWMVTGGNTWQSAGPFTGLAAGNVVLDTGFVPSASALVVQAAFQTGGGQWSPWSASATPTRALLTPGGHNIELPGGAGHVILP